MCIICVKPVGVAMPLMETLRYCWAGNNDGAGLAYWKVGMNTVRIEKGFMKFKFLRRKLNALELGKDDLMVLHFRYATHGVVDSGNCHPFPLSNKIEALRCTSGDFPSVVAHNGVFGDVPCHDKMSDTMKFIRCILSNPVVVNGLDNKAIKSLIMGYCGESSKLAILRPGKMLLIGDFIEDKGLLYSNDGYKPYKYITYNDNEGCGWPGHFDNSLNDVEDGLIPLKQGCELCHSKIQVNYDPDFQLDLCKKCLEFNTSVKNIK